MRVSLSNGCVEITERRGLREKKRTEHFKDLLLAGTTEEEALASFDYSRTAKSKEEAKKLREKQNAGLIRLKHFSIEKVLGLDGLPPGLSVLGA